MKNKTKKDCSPLQTPELKECGHPKYATCLCSPLQEPREKTERGQFAHNPHIGDTCDCEECVPPQPEKTDLRRLIEIIISREDECESPIEECHWNKDTADQLEALFQSKGLSIKEVEEMKNDETIEYALPDQQFRIGYNKALDDIIEKLKKG